MTADDLPDDVETFEGVWLDNVQTVLAFLSIQTQWRCLPLPSGRIHKTGLDYSAGRVGIEAAGFDISPDLWAGVLIIEAGALEAQSGG